MVDRQLASPQGAPRTLALRNVNDRARGSEVCQVHRTQRTVSSSVPDPATLDEMLRRVGTGDGDALAEVYDVTAPRAFGLALRVVHNRSLAEDVTQDAYLEIWRKSGSFDPTRGTAMGWIMMLVHRKAVNCVRSAQARSNRDAAYAREDRQDELTSSQDPTADQVLAASEGTRVRRALAQLPAVQRESIELAYFDAYTCTEIARITQVPLGSAKSRMRDGLIRLRDLMGVPPP